MSTQKYVYDYPRPAVTTDIIIVNKSHPYSVLLIQRKNDPYKEFWALPGGFLELHETTAECAARELAEETGLILKPSQLTLYSIADKIDRDPRQRTISVVYTYVGWNIINMSLKAADDAKDIKWVRFEDIWNNKIELAFDHQEILDYYYV